MKRVFLPVSIVAPPLLVATAIALWSVDVPYWDQWEFVAELAEIEAGAQPLEVFARPHNEHVLLAPKLVMWGLAHASAWNVRLELWTCFLLALVTATLAFFGLRDTAREGSEVRAQNLVLASAISLVVFSLAQWENWTWGWQIQVWLCVASATGALLGLSRREWPITGLVAGGLLAILATLSYGIGLVTWPAGAVSLARQRRWRALLGWCLLAGLAVWSYWQWTGRDGATPLPSPVFLGAYVAVYLGGPLAYFDGKLAGLVGLVGLAVYGFVAGRELRSRSVDPSRTFALSLATLALGGAVLTALGRAHLGLELALSSRYVTVANLFWLGLLPFGFDALARFDSKGPRRVVAGAFVALVLASSIFGVHPLVEEYRERSQCVAAIRAGDPTDLSTLYIGEDRVRSGLVWLRARNWSLFRSP